MRKFIPIRIFYLSIGRLNIYQRAMTAAAPIVENEDSDAENEAERKAIDEMFPNWPFDVSVNIGELDNDLRSKSN